MDEKLVKSLTSLIDETIAEIEDLKKSRFSAAEVKLGGPGEDGIAGKPASGSIGKEEDEEAKKEEAKKHFAEFLEAAVESVIGLDAYSMVPALKRTLDYYEQLACDHTSSETNEYNAHYKAGKKYAKFKD